MSNLANTRNRPIRKLPGDCRSLFACLIRDVVEEDARGPDTHMPKGADCCQIASDAWRQILAVGLPFARTTRRRKECLVAGKRGGASNWSAWQGAITEVTLEATSHGWSQTQSILSDPKDGGLLGTA